MHLEVLLSPSTPMPVTQVLKFSTVPFCAGPDGEWQVVPGPRLRPAVQHQRARDQHRTVTVSYRFHPRSIPCIGRPTSWSTYPIHIPYPDVGVTRTGLVRRSRRTTARRRSRSTSGASRRAARSRARCSRGAWVQFNHLHQPFSLYFSKRFRRLAPCDR